MLTLHEYTPSQNCWKVRVLLGLLGIPYRSQPVAIFSGESRAADFLARAGAALAAPFRAARARKVAGIEARGFILATAVALELGAGFVAVRKQGSVHPGPKAELRGPPDWRGLETVLRLQRHVIEPGDRVLLVDDWAETGSKAATARRLIEECGGVYIGLSL